MFVLKVLLTSVLLDGCLAASLIPRISSTRTNTCVVASNYNSSGGQADDTPAFEEALKRCSANANIILNASDYNILTPISATNLSNVGIHVQGNLHLPRNITAVQEVVNDTTKATNGSSLYWFKFAGPQLDFIGISDIRTGWIESYGQAWWDANPVNGTGTPSRPHLMSFNTTNGSIQRLKSRKPIAWNVQIIGRDISVTDPIIDAVSNSSAFPFNTDGFDIQAQNVDVSNFMIYNGDDAFAIQSGAHNVKVHSGTIGYQSHGLSIGSLGQNQGVFANVSNIWFDDITVIDAVYGSRFKSWVGGQGLAKNITWSNIKLYNVSFPIYVTQTYVNQGSNQTQLQTGGTSGRPNNSTVMLQDIKWSNFTGTLNSINPGDGSCVTDPCWYDVGLPNREQTESIIVECTNATSCQGLEFENINVFPETLQDPTVVCMGPTTALNPNLGIECRNGSFVPV